MQFQQWETGSVCSKGVRVFQSQGYWVERTFDDSKNKPGLSD
jgi:hypothetical protein